MSRAHRPLLVLALLSLFGTASSGLSAGAPNTSAEQASSKQDDFYPPWAAAARHLRPIAVLDTDSAIGRRSLHPKWITLKDMARMHGHLCDGLVTSWVELSAALGKLFPNGVIDRTDVRAVSRNCPCCADAAAWMTGARVNQGTLMLDNAIGDGFIVQRISTGKAVRVWLRAGVYPSRLAELERSIRSRRASGKAVSADAIDRFEREADAYSRRLLDTPPEQAVALEEPADFVFPERSSNPIAPRSDIINRDAPRNPLVKQGLRGE